MKIYDDDMMMSTVVQLFCLLVIQVRILSK